jgi:hypothetical protein
MVKSVNLMSEGAQFRSTADRLLRQWALVLGGILAVMTPLAAWAWTERRGAAQEHAALVARYEPIRRLAADNRRLGEDARKLVADERTALKLSRRRPVAALLAAVSEAVRATDGEAFVEHINVARDGGAKPEDIDPAGRLLLEVATTEGYDVSQLTKALDQPPFTSVKVTLSDAVREGDVPRNTHTIECQF